MSGDDLTLGDRVNGVGLHTIRRPGRFSIEVNGFSRVLNLAAGDYVEIFTKYNTGTTGELKAGSDRTGCEMTRLG